MVTNEKKTIKNEKSRKFIKKRRPEGFLALGAKNENRTFCIKTRIGSTIFQCFSLLGTPREFRCGTRQLLINNQAFEIIRHFFRILDIFPKIQIFWDVGNFSKVGVFFLHPLPGLGANIFYFDIKVAEIGADMGPNPSTFFASGLSNMNRKNLCQCLCKIR